MKLIIGLGNIGKEYEQTRHNVGFACLQKLALVHNLKFRLSKNISYAKYKDAILLMPQTYMNSSGNAYKSALSKFSRFDEVMVIMDDIDLPIGEIRIRVSGGSGGHNGLKSIIEAAVDIDIIRIRIGIGRPDNGSPRKHVLDNFNSREKPVISELLSLIVNWLDVYLSQDVQSLLNEYSKWKKPIPLETSGINRPKEETND